MERMNIIMPLGGIGKRFSEKGHLFLKPFVKVKGKPMIFWVLESLQASGIYRIFIPYHKLLSKFHFEEELKKSFPQIDFQFLRLEEETKGASETVYKMLDNMYDEDLKRPFFTIDGDNFYLCDLRNVIKDKMENGLVYFKDYNKNPIYSYIKFDENGYLKEIKEKIKISDNANSGIYIFRNGYLFMKYYRKLIESGEGGEKYTSKIYDLMLKDGEKIKCHNIDRNDFVCLGTPEQIANFSINSRTKHKNRICFDLDNVLVTYPRRTNDYDTVAPIQKNIDFLNKLKDEGNYIIIYTSRRMKTHKGNIVKVKEDIGELTERQLKKFGINYDELIFGKPYADFYIDDKAVNSFADLNKEIGYYFKNSDDSRHFNTITYFENSVKKVSDDEAIKGEIYYYNNIPEKLKSYFLELKDFGENNYTIEKINAISFSDLFINGLLSQNDLDELLKILNVIHLNSGVLPEGASIYDNYFPKVNKRYEEFNYSQFENSLEIFNFLKNHLLDYSSQDKGVMGMIHGDPTFTNILFDKQKNQIKIIDMRGILGDKKTIFGDIFYDYAKIYHSIIGYDFILKGLDTNHEIINPLRIYFENYISNKYGTERLNLVKILTLSLFFSLIPLHQKKNQSNFWKLVKTLYRELINNQ